MGRISGAMSRFEYRSQWSAAPNFLAHSEETQRCSIAIQGISDSKLRGRDRKLGDFVTVAKQEHALIRGANEEHMPVVSGASSHQYDQEEKAPVKVHATERDGFNAISCCTQNATDFRATYVKPPRNINRNGTESQ
jgi:hypothetical protein